MRFANTQGFYELNEMPGCSQIVVSNNAFIHHVHRGRGCGKKQHRERVIHAHDMGFDFMIATVVSTNAIGKHIMASHGWSKMNQFRSTKTGHIVEIWGRHLKEEQPIQAI